MLLSLALLCTLGSSIALYSSDAENSCPLDADIDPHYTHLVKAYTEHCIINLPTETMHDLARHAGRELPFASTPLKELCSFARTYTNLTPDLQQEHIASIERKCGALTLLVAPAGEYVIRKAGEMAKRECRSILHEAARLITTRQELLEAGDYHVTRERLPHL